MTWNTENDIMSVRRNNKLLVTEQHYDRSSANQNVQTSTNVRMCQIVFLYISSWPIMTWRERLWITCDTWVCIKINFYRPIMIYTYLIPTSYNNIVTVSDHLLFLIRKLSKMSQLKYVLLCLLFNYLNNEKIK